jgi:hypothetical protein
MNKMKLLTFLATILLFTGCSEGLKSLESDLIIKISGTPGVKFKGNYSFPGTGGMAQKESVEAATPAEYRGRGLAALCVFRKTETAGTLMVEVFNGSKLIDSAETSAAYGVITLGKIPDQQSIMNSIQGKIMEALGM